MPLLLVRQAALVALGLREIAGIFVRSADLVLDADSAGSADKDRLQAAQALHRRSPPAEEALSVEAWNVEGVNSSLPSTSGVWGEKADRVLAPDSIDPMLAPGLPSLEEALGTEAANPSLPSSGGLWGQKALGALVPDSAEVSLAPGCYMRMPTGCPRQQDWRTAYFQRWQKDPWGGWKEGNVAAGTAKTTCEEDRKAKLAGWCGTHDVETRYVDAVEAWSILAPPPPAQEGCYVWAPGGCPAQPSFDALAWKSGWAPDSWPGWQEARMGAARAASTCNDERQSQLLGWCGANLLTRWMRQAPREPEAPGCYVHLPSGCPKQQPEFDASGYQSGWRPDARGEGFDAGAASQATCGEDRRHQINSWCGTVDARVLLVGSTPPEPAGEGCYAWMPSGCPRQTTFDASRYRNAWVLDAGDDWRTVQFLDSNAEAKYRCSVEFKQKIQEYCGAADVRTLYVGQPPKPPERPGCYLMLPFGCPKQPRFDASKWQDQWGPDEWVGWPQASGRAESERRRICEVGRKRSLGDWCGTKSVRAVMVFHN